jgi:geranylgeranyl diphosphate synthase type I
MINDELEKRAILVSDAIRKFLPIKHPETLYEASRHLLDAPGYKISSAMLLLAGEAVGGDQTSLIPAAVSIELIHSYTCIHDDILDNSKMRYGLPAVHTLWGVNNAIVAGDTLLAYAFEFMTQVKAENSLKLLAWDILAKACTTISEGQWLDSKLFMDKEKVSEEEYLEMIEMKTGALFGASASIGAVLSGGSKEAIRGLEQFGRLIGKGFQLHDDVLDITSAEDETGKVYGGDIIEGKKTLMVIHALDHGSNVDFFGKEGVTLKDIDRARSILEDIGSIDHSRKKAIQFVESGKLALKTLPNSDAKSILLDLADYMIGKRHK